ncbi:WXG100 family type VII secretion target [Schaalia suimastitidis]|uniref:WXG100 family type VII secretion target n=1 Tax=Schaalia suimastitidis TaxID=121163 RepID=UPI000408DECF|nr:WXG100 family type VII secretion target [Schaalia suimastitidis]
MAGHILAEDGAIIRGADVVAASREELAKHIAEVEAVVSRIGSGWTGEAALAFHRLMETWNASTRKVNGALEGFEQNLRGTQADFDATDQQQQEALNRLAARLG